MVFLFYIFIIHIRIINFLQKFLRTESLYTNSYGRNYPVYTDKTAALFSESEGVKAFEKEKILDRFVNSFLVEAGKSEVKEKEEILYVKLNQGRKKSSSADKDYPPEW